MGLGDTFKIWKFEKTRVEGLSDGVFSIIMTLLILEIKIPYENISSHIQTSQELWRELKTIFPVFFSWVISFLILGVFWRNHHCIFMMSKKCDYALSWMNTIFLLLISFIPFPAHLMGTYPDIPLAVASLGIVMLLSTAVLATMYHYVAENYLSDDFHKETVMQNVRLAFILAPFVYILTIGLAWISTTITFICYAIIPLIFILPLDKPVRKKVLHE